MQREAAFSSFRGRDILTLEPVGQASSLPLVWQAGSLPHDSVVMASPQTTPPDDRPRRPPLSWRAHAVAVFVTFHLACVIVYALPRPPAMGDDILQHPEVKAELDQGFSALHRVVPWRGTPDEMRDDILRVVRGYTRFLDRIRRTVEPYLELAGSTQSWHMFGGTPPRFPLVFVVEVQPQGEPDFVLFQDLHWGTSDSAAMNFRHRKTHELLSYRGSAGDWSAYAAYWARRWDAKHPDRPARRVRLSFERLTTPSPEQVRRGEGDRRPERLIDPGPFVWERP